MRPAEALRVVERHASVEDGVWTWTGTEEERVAAALALEAADDEERGRAQCVGTRTGRHRMSRERGEGLWRCTACPATQRGAA